MSSLKMTFSLTSLILIIALGLVFAPVSVMAHKVTPADNTADSHTVGDGVATADHTAHPVVKSITLLGDAADGYVGNDSYVVEVKFEPASTANKISVPTGTAAVALESTPAGAITSTIDTHRINATTYRIRISSSGGTTGTEYTISVIAGSDTIFTPADPATGAEDNPAKAMVTYDNIAPTVAPGTAQPLSGEAFPLNNELEDPFDVVFVIDDQMVSGTSSRAMTLDGDSFMLMASPDTVTFSNERYLGSGRFVATVTPKMVDADETDETSVTITASVEDKSGNSGMNTATVTLAARMKGDGTGDGEDADPPAAMITVTEMMSVGVMGRFRVRVQFTPAEGEDAVDVAAFADHNAFLTFEDSTTPTAVEVPVSLAMTTEENPVPPELKTDNLYDAILEYDTRLFEGNSPLYTYPLVISIDQDALETSNADADDASGEVGEPVDPPDPPETRAVATLTGPADGDLLSGEFQVLITFSEETTLSEDEILVTPTTAGHVTRGSLNPSSGEHDEFTVRIQPYGGAEMITVTVDDNDRIVPDEDNGSIMDSAPIGTLMSITGPDDFDGTDPFVVELTFDEEGLPDGEMVTTDDLMVTGGAATAVGAKLGSDTVYEVQITPTDTADVVVGLSTTGMGRFTYAGDALTVDQKDDAPTAGDVTAAYDADTKTTTISDGAIAANGFVVIDYSDLPDLELFFDIGGTIGLDDGDDADDENSRTVVISEILWGLDFGEVVLTNQRKHQFIELYNTTADVVDISDWKLVFTRGNVVPASDIDQVSNRGRTGWEVDEGDTGKSGRVAETLANNPASTITPVNIISMYRNINYTHVETQATKDTVDRAELVKGIPGGNAKGSWKNSELRSTNRWIYSTPGAKHHSRVGLLVASSVAGTPFRINEIGNDVSGDNDWVELHNVSDAEASLKNYALSAVTAKGTDTRLFHFHDQDYKVPAKGFIVVSTRHPSLTDLATGKDISIADEDELNKGLKHLYAVKGDWNLPDDGKFALILRSAHDKSGKAEALIDVIAARSGAFADNEISTDLWPLTATGKPHENVIDGTDEDFRAGRVFKRNSGNGRGEKQLALAGYTGIGYDVKAAKVTSNHGTPGYDNGAARDKKAALTGGVVTISEIMVDIGSARRNLPQWIELHNSSATEGVNLNGWKLHIENAGSANGDPQTNTFYATVTIGAKTILPNQTLLVASSTGNVRDPNHFPPTRVVNLWTTKAHRDALEMTRSTDPVLSTRGFNITLVDKDNVEIDVAGNLDGNRRTRDEPAWALPMYEAPDGRSRSSILRVYDQKVAVDGTMEDAWILASDTILAFEVSHAYYGNADDVGSPGYRTGGPLPVSLSKFRPERLKDTGEVVVRWITESELNNAGFNILRSEKRDGEFTKVHYQAGQGTTTERTVYEWKDKSAKPNVVYYYQIQDVSLDGDVTTLRTTHLRGNVTAAGKLTTTWAGLKALQ